MNTTPITPLDDNVLVQTIDTSQDKIGSIYIPETAKEKSITGIVLAVGSDEDLNKILKKGDKIIYTQLGAREIKIKGEEYLIIQRENILAKYED